MQGSSALLARGRARDRQQRISRRVERRTPLHPKYSYVCIHVYICMNVKNKYIYVYIHIYPYIYLYVYMCKYDYKCLKCLYMCMDPALYLLAGVLAIVSNVFHGASSVVRPQHPPLQATRFPAERERERERKREREKEREREKKREREKEKIILVPDTRDLDSETRAPARCAACLMKPTKVETPHSQPREHETPKLPNTKHETFEPNSETLQPAPCPRILLLVLVWLMRLLGPTGIPRSYETSIPLESL